MEREIETDTLPFVSILVPARDEASNIEQCVRSLIAQVYEPLEVIVLDDNSSDATSAIVQRIIDELPATQQKRLQLVQGKPLPPGWVGKNFACQQLAQQAHGDYLLFTDADTIHAPDTAQAVISCMQHYGVTLLTAQPEFVLGSLGERLIVPLLNFTIMTLLPVALVRLRPEPSLATGNGQLLCFHRLAYTKIGGHAAVKDNILEDVLLARAIKKAGERMIFVDALEFVRCRMYRSWSGVWAGFSKNLFALYNYSLPFALIALLLNLALFVLPPLLIVVALLFHLPTTLLLYATTAYTFSTLMRVLLTLRFTRLRHTLPSLLFLCLLHPLSMTLEGIILLHAIYCWKRKLGVAWKGRNYQ